MKKFEILKIGGNINFYIRSKKVKVNRWLKIAFCPLKWHFSIVGFLKPDEKAIKGPGKAYDLHFLKEYQTLFKKSHLKNEA